MDTNRIAHELHRRRLSNNSSAPRHQAAGEALFWGVIDREPTSDDYDAYMQMQARTAIGEITVATSTEGVYELAVDRVLNVEYIFFTKGEKLAETQLVGWLPRQRVLAAPSPDARSSKVLVNEACLFPIPEGEILTPGVLEEPVVNVPGVWDYDLQAMWTPLGFHLYDGELRRLVQSADAKRLT